MKPFPFLIDIFDLILPRICSHCNKRLNNKEKLLCGSCMSDLAEADEIDIENEFIMNFQSEEIISGLISGFQFRKDGALQSAVHSLKYNGAFQNGLFLGKLIGSNKALQIMDWGIDLIVPVPLHYQKKYERGYNQAYYIAKGISIKTGIKLRTDIIKRIRYTQTQTKLTSIQRKTNINAAFKAVRSKAIIGKSILLVDDIITTGSTITECAKTLLMNGALKVYAASIAIAK